MCESEIHAFLPVFRGGFRVLCPSGFLTRPGLTYSRTCTPQRPSSAAGLRASCEILQVVHRQGKMKSPRATDFLPNSCRRPRALSTRRRADLKSTSCAGGQSCHSSRIARRLAANRRSVYDSACRSAARSGSPTADGNSAVAAFGATCPAEPSILSNSAGGGSNRAPRPAPAHRVAGSAGASARRRKKRAPPNTDPGGGGGGAGGRGPPRGKKHVDG